MAEKHTDQELLELYVERVIELMNLHLWKQEPLSYSFNISTTEGMDLQQPNEEQMRSFMMTFRLFVQEKEPTHFSTVRNIAYKSLKPNLPKIDSKKAHLNNLKTLWNMVLQGNSHKTDSASGDGITPKQILNTYLNGQYFHSDKSHRKTLKEFSKIDRKDFLDAVISCSQLIKGLKEFIELGLSDNWFDFSSSK